MTPKELLKLRGTVLQPGDVIKWHEGEFKLPVDPVRGAIPNTEVLEVGEKGLKLGRFKCQKCGQDELVHAGDIFQKRLCSQCKKTKKPKTDKTEKKAKRVEDERAKLMAKLQEAEKRIALIHDEANRQNVEVSEKVSFL